MPPIEPNAPPAQAATPRRPRVQIGNRLGTKLILLLLAALAATFALLGYLNIRLHRRHLEAATQLSAERVSDVIKRSTSYYMLRNDREGLYHVISTMGGEPGIVRIRIFNQEGRISFSTDPGEINTYVAKDAEACYACHAAGQPLVHLDRPDRIRIYRAGGARVMGLINPIENRPQCSNAPCHAHPPEQKILGVLDANLSLAQADAGLAESTQRMLAYTLLAALVISVFVGLLVWRLVARPLKDLKRGTERLARGELGYQIRTAAQDEVGEVAASFNDMSRQLAEAQDSLTAWARTLEERVEQKTQELKRANQQMLQSEKLASIGKLAAVVAHEINNPLSGMLTYTKLVRKWVDRGGNGDRREEMLKSLQLMESEIRRCGELVKNMLMFSRAAPMNLAWNEVNTLFDRALRLVQHKAELAGVQVQTELEPELPPVHCDAAQVEQVLLALIINAIEAMPRGGVLRLRTRSLPTGEVQIQVQDEGVGIPTELLPRLFEPFQTTKEAGGVGLGLAVSRQIVERHNGRIEVQSEPGRGTTFTITLPVGAEQPAAQAR